MEPGPRYTCAQCKKTYFADWPEAEAEKEYVERFGHLPKAVREQRMIVCNDCYRMFMKWMRAQFYKSDGKVTLKN